MTTELEQSHNFNASGFCKNLDSFDAFLDEVALAVLVHAVGLQGGSDHVSKPWEKKKTPGRSGRMDELSRSEHTGNLLRWSSKLDNRTSLSPAPPVLRRSSDIDPRGGKNMATPHVLRRSSHIDPRGGKTMATLPATSRRQPSDGMTRERKSLFPVPSRRTLIGVKGVDRWLIWTKLYASVDGHRGLVVVVLIVVVVVV